MKGLNILVLATGLYGLTSCIGDKGKVPSYQKIYEIGEIPNIESFMTLLKEEIQMDKRYPIEDTLKGKVAFSNNRSRIFLDGYKNGQIQKKESVYYKGLPTHCSCHTANDTTFIIMGLGFFGGFGFTITIYQEKFESGFLEYADDVQSYKTDLDDTAFYDRVQVNNKFQSLIVDKKLTYKTGQQLTGLLTYTTNNYYERDYSDSLDTIYVTGKVYFTCRIRKKELPPTENKAH